MDALWTAFGDLSSGRWLCRLTECRPQCPWYKCSQWLNSQGGEGQTGRHKSIRMVQAFRPNNPHHSFSRHRMGGGNCGVVARSWIESHFTRVRPPRRSRPNRAGCGTRWNGFRSTCVQQTPQCRPSRWREKLMVLWDARPEPPPTYLCGGFS